MKLILPGNINTGLFMRIVWRICIIQKSLFNSIRSGCVTYYISDPDLTLPHLKGAFIQSCPANLEVTEDNSADIVKEMRKVMFIRTMGNIFL